MSCGSTPATMNSDAGVAASERAAALEAQGEATTAALKALADAERALAVNIAATDEAMKVRMRLAEAASNDVRRVRETSTLDALRSAEKSSLAVTRGIQTAPPPNLERGGPEGPAVAPPRLFTGIVATPDEIRQLTTAEYLRGKADKSIDEKSLLVWRRHLHQNPELSNREVETAKYIAAALRDMGLEPKTGVAHNGVVAVIKGGLPGKVVALRADIDALPVKEEVNVPFASRATGTYEGKTVGVMHACGHDAHVAMLLTAAKSLMTIRAELHGTVVLLFQPAEEGVPKDEKPAGAELMVKQGVLDSPKVDAVFGLHVFAGMKAGTIGYRSGPFMAAADTFEIIVEGRQTHGSKPWAGVDPIVAACAMVGSLQTIASRNVDVTDEPAVVTVGQFESGVRNNIIPDRARLVGTVRTFNNAMRSMIHRRIREVAEHVATAHGATAKVHIETGYPVTANNSALMEWALPTLTRLVPGGVAQARKLTGAEDFSFYAQRVPAVFLFLGITTESKLATADSNHSPRFEIDESALPTGARALAHLAIDFLLSPR